MVLRKESGMPKYRLEKVLATTLEKRDVAPIRELIEELSPGRSNRVSLRTLRACAQSSHLWLARDRCNGKPVAVCIVSIIVGTTGKRGYLTALVVQSAHRQRGVAEQLHQRVVAELRRRKIRNIFLTCARFRDPAHRFYQKHGYLKRASDVFDLALAVPLRVTSQGHF